MSLDNPFENLKKELEKPKLPVHIKVTIENNDHYRIIYRFGSKTSYDESISLEVFIEKNICKSVDLIYDESTHLLGDKIYSIHKKSVPLTNESFQKILLDFYRDVGRFVDKNNKYKSIYKHTRSEDIQKVYGCILNAFKRSLSLDHEKFDIDFEFARLLYFPIREDPTFSVDEIKGSIVLFKKRWLQLYNDFIQPLFPSLDSQHFKEVVRTLDSKQQPISNVLLMKDLFLHIDSFLKKGGNRKKTIKKKRKRKRNTRRR